MLSVQALHGVFLILIGLAGYYWNPSKAVSALIAGSITGGVNLLLDVRKNSGANWAFRASTYLNAMFLLLFAWRANGAWHAYLDGNEEKFVPAVLISLMLFSTLTTLTLTRKKPTVVDNIRRKAN